MSDTRDEFPASATVYPDIMVQRQISDARPLCTLQQSSSSHVQIHRPTCHKQSGSILAQTTVTNLVEAKDPFEVQKRMFDFSPCLRFGFVPGFYVRTQWTVPASLQVGQIFRIGCMFTNRVVLSCIGRITHTRVSSPCSKSPRTWLS